MCSLASHLIFLDLLLFQFQYPLSCPIFSRICVILPLSRVSLHIPALLTLLLAYGCGLPLPSSFLNTPAWLLFPHFLLWRESGTSSIPWCSRCAWAPQESFPVLPDVIKPWPLGKRGCRVARNSQGPLRPVGLSLSLNQLPGALKESLFLLTICDCLSEALNYQTLFCYSLTKCWIDLKPVFFHAQFRCFFKDTYRCLRNLR